MLAFAEAIDGQEYLLKMYYRDGGTWCLKCMNLPIRSPETPQSSSTDETINLEKEQKNTDIHYDPLTSYNQELLHRQACH